MPEFISGDGADLIKRILTTDPTKRITVEQIKQHPWFNLRKQTLPKNPGTFIGIDCAPIDLDILKQLTEH
ncbi:MAG: hypothetical protein ACK521_00740 [bacterium]